MKQTKIIYWTTTGIISAMMLMSGAMYFTSPEAVEGFKKLGFPDFFRVELGVAKLVGVIALLVPQVPMRIKEWAYAGFGIVFISAAIAHYASGDVKGAIMPIVMLVVLLVSNMYLHKTKAV
ncbi:MAG: DoxX family protein [Bacteroidia bacterium]